MLDSKMFLETSNLSDFFISEQTAEFFETFSWDLRGWRRHANISDEHKTKPPKTTAILFLTDRSTGWLGSLNKQYTKKFPLNWLEN